MPTSKLRRDRPFERWAWFPKVVRYTGGSIVATVCSEVVFVLAYGVAHLSPGWSSFLAWLAGAIPNYWLNRSWTWRRRGRPSLRHEVVPYALIVGVTLLLAILATVVADRLLTQADITAGARVVLVAATYFAVYAGMFVLRFFLFDRLFRDDDSHSEDESEARSGAQPPVTRSESGVTGGGPT